MELIIMDKNFQRIGVIEKFESLIWVERYSRPGDFELYTSVDPYLLSTLTIGMYLYSIESEYIMIVESISIETDVEVGNHLTIKGRSLESILDRRIIWSQTILESKIQEGIKKLIEENVINPEDEERKIDNFIVEEVDDPIIDKIEIEKQYTGTNLLDAVEELCLSENLGFKINLDEDNKFVFKLYSGKDRTFKQTDNPYVIFSPSYENLLNSSYKESSMDFRNVALVAGEGEGSNRKKISINLDEVTGLERRELFVDARDISSETIYGTLEDSVYYELLRGRGLDKLNNYLYDKTFEGEVEPHQTFTYGKDYYIGDMVQLINEYGMETESRITEIIRSQSESGYTVIPTFTPV